MSLPKIWLNIDEFMDLFKSELEPHLLNALDDKLDMFKNSCEIMNEIYDILPEDKFKDIARKLHDLVLGLKYSGEFHVDGLRDEVPPLKMDYDILWKPPERINLTGIQFELTGWKPYDLYSLIIEFKDKSTRTLIDKVPFKEVGEHKTLPIAYPFGLSRKTHKLGADDTVIFRVHNNSGNSRQVYLDIEYLSLGNLPPSGSTILFLDISGSMWNLLDNMAGMIISFFQNLLGTDPVSICFVASRGGDYKRGSYDFIKKDFVNKFKAIEYLTNHENIPHRGGGSFDIVTIQCVLDYKLNQYDNYVFCTDQPLESDPDPKFIENIKKFFNHDQEVFSIPVNESDRIYWSQVYKELGLFKPIK